MEVIKMKIISTRKYKGDIHSIKFIDDNINVSDEISKLWLIGKNVELMNTSISNTKSIDIESDNLIIDSSHITFGEITIDSSHVYINGIQLNSNEKYQNKRGNENGITRHKSSKDEI